VKTIFHKSYTPAYTWRITKKGMNMVQSSSTGMKRWIQMASNTRQFTSLPNGGTGQEEKSEWVIQRSERIRAAASDYPIRDFSKTMYVSQTILSPLSWPWTQMQLGWLVDIFAHQPVSDAD
jgi:hypothetical protein